KNGGRRPGAGRPKGAKNKATPEERVVLEVVQRGIEITRETFGTVAREYASCALQALAETAMHDPVGSARVMAAKELLDRGYGKVREAKEEPVAPLDAPWYLRVGHETGGLRIDVGGEGVREFDLVEK